MTWFLLAHALSRLAEQKRNQISHWLFWSLGNHLGLMDINVSYIYLKDILGALIFFMLFEFKLVTDINV